ncbi:hypothetical protein [Mariniflexile sp. AS56]|uniref:hypothetical protein n=1 Tax=Mariniflexile sp. AS56 TaxID=3063957 RepID=UPI0026EF89F4|nr:hypothetical protein [Mariniflexile sp. AS56]MDO7171988.1 hypothetical protein [Mariniflexile sp. AS56]
MLIYQYKNGIIYPDYSSVDILMKDPTHSKALNDKVFPYLHHKTLLICKFKNGHLIETMAISGSGLPYVPHIDSLNGPTGYSVILHKHLIRASVKLFLMHTHRNKSVDYNELWNEPKNYKAH